MIGDDLSCVGGGNTKIPDATCEVTGNVNKAKWRIVELGRAGLRRPALGGRAPSSWATRGGGAGCCRPIWTIPKQETGATNPLCGGTQLDTLANFVSDGWACLAVFASDRLGNKQVSKPMRICVDKDVDGKECPHKEIAAVRDTTPLTVETVADHGYATGDQVKVSGIFLPAIVNGDLDHHRDRPAQLHAWTARRRRPKIPGLRAGATGSGPARRSASRRASSPATWCAPPRPPTAPAPRPSSPP